MLVGIAVCLILLSISEQFLFSHIITQWSYDRKIGIVHTIVGAITGLMGLVGIILLVKEKMKLNEKLSGKWIAKMILLYIGLQLVAAVTQGLISEGLGRFTSLEYEIIKTSVYWLSGIIQTFIRIVFLFALFLSYYHLKFKEHKKILFKGIMIGILFCIVLFVLRFTLTNIALLINQVLWEIVCILFFIIYFGKNMKEKTKQ